MAEIRIGRRGRPGGDKKNPADHLYTVTQHNEQTGEPLLEGEQYRYGIRPKEIADDVAHIIATRQSNEGNSSTVRDQAKAISIRRRLKAVHVEPSRRFPGYIRVINRGKAGDEAQDCVACGDIENSTHLEEARQIARDIEQRTGGGVIDSTKPKAIEIRAYQSPSDQTRYYVANRGKQGNEHHPYVGSWTDKQQAELAARALIDATGQDSNYTQPIDRTIQKALSVSSSPFRNRKGIVRVRRNRTPHDPEQFPYTTSARDRYGRPSEEGQTEQGFLLDQTEFGANRTAEAVADAATDYSGEYHTIDARPRSSFGNENAKSLIRPSPFRARHKFFVPEKKRYGCLMASIPSPLANQILSWSRSVIPQKHLTMEGIQADPHITIKYGFVEDDQATIRKIREYLTSVGPIKVKLKGLDHFPDSGDGAVLLVKIDSPQLKKVNSYISKHFACEDKYPEYKPHLTLAYIQPQYLPLYEDIQEALFDQEIEITHTVFSDKHKVKEVIPLVRTTKALSAMDSTLGGALIAPPAMGTRFRKHRAFRAKTKAQPQRDAERQAPEFQPPDPEANQQLLDRVIEQHSTTDPVTLDKIITDYEAGNNAQPAPPPAAAEKEEVKPAPVPPETKPETVPASVQPQAKLDQAIPATDEKVKTSSQSQSEEPKIASTPTETTKEQKEQATAQVQAQQAQANAASQAPAQAQAQPQTAQQEAEKPKFTDTANLLKAKLTDPDEKITFKEVETFKELFTAIPPEAAKELGTKLFDQIPPANPETGIPKQAYTEAISKYLETKKTQTLAPQGQEPIASQQPVAAQALPTIEQQATQLVETYQQAKQQAPSFSKAADFNQNLEKAPLETLKQAAKDLKLTIPPNKNSEKKATYVNEIMKDFVSPPKPALKPEDKTTYAPPKKLPVDSNDLKEKLDGGVTPQEATKLIATLSNYDTEDLKKLNKAVLGFVPHKSEQVPEKELNQLYLQQKIQTEKDLTPLMSYQPKDYIANDVSMVSGTVYADINQLAADLSYSFAYGQTNKETLNSVASHLAVADKQDLQTLGSIYTPQIKDPKPQQILEAVAQKANVPTKEPIAATIAPKQTKFSDPKAKPQAAGTLIYRDGQNGLEVLVIHPSGSYNKHENWTLPKGRIDLGETSDWTARRETGEEVGISVGALADLGHFTTSSGKKLQVFSSKAPLDANPTLNSWEIDQAVFVPIEQAATLLQPSLQSVISRLQEVTQTSPTDELKSTVTNATHVIPTTTKVGSHLEDKDFDTFLKVVSSLQSTAAEIKLVWDNIILPIQDHNQLLEMIKACSTPEAYALNVKYNASSLDGLKLTLQIKLGAKLVVAGTHNWDDIEVLLPISKSQVPAKTVKKSPFTEEAFQAVNWHPKEVAALIDTVIDSTNLSTTDFEHLKKILLDNASIYFLAKLGIHLDVFPLDFKPDPTVHRAEQLIDRIINAILPLEFDIDLSGDDLIEEILDNFPLGGTSAVPKTIFHDPQLVKFPQPLFDHLTSGAGITYDDVLNLKERLQESNIADVFMLAYKLDIPNFNKLFTDSSGVVIDVKTGFPANPTNLIDLILIHVLSLGSVYAQYNNPLHPVNIFNQSPKSGEDAGGLLNFIITGSLSREQLQFIASHLGLTHPSLSAPSTQTLCHDIAWRIFEIVKSKLNPSQELTIKQLVLKLAKTPNVPDWMTQPSPIATPTGTKPITPSFQTTKATTSHQPNASDLAAKQSELDKLLYTWHEGIASTPKPLPSGFPASFKELIYSHEVGQGGTRPKIYKNSAGESFIVKTGNSYGHVREEAYANDMYQAMGIPVPDFYLYETPDQGPIKVSRFLAGGIPLKDWQDRATPLERQEMYSKIRKHFAFDALMGNWDVTGMSFDNIMITPEGIPVRIDVGGSLRYRALGDIKTYGQWNYQVNDVENFRNAQIAPQASEIFRRLSVEELASQVREIIAKKQQILEAAPEAIRKLMEDRITWLANQFAMADEVTDTIPNSIYVGPGADWPDFPPDPFLTYKPDSTELKHPLFQKLGMSEPRQHISHTTLPKTFVDYYQTVLKNLTKDEITGINRYTGSGSHTINYSMRTNSSDFSNIDSTNRYAILQIQKAISKAGSLKQPINVWRNTGLISHTTDGKNFLKALRYALKTGEATRIPGIMSTSFSPDVTTGGGDIKLEIRAKTGLLVTEISAYQHEEKEFLKAHNCRYRVLGIQAVKVGSAYPLVLDPNLPDKEFATGSAWGLSNVRYVVQMEEI